MAISTTLVLFMSSLLLFPLLTTSDSNSDLVAELSDLESRSKTGVIHLTDHLVHRFLVSPKTPRPYHLLIFFDALQLHDKSELNLKQIHREFNLVASSFLANNGRDPNHPSGSDPKLFFCYIEFKESQSSFAQFGVNSLPHIRIVGPDVTNLKDSDQMDQGDASRMADSISDFVLAKTGFSVGPITRPPILSKTQISLLAIVFLISLPFLVKRVLAGQTLLHDPKIWLSGSVFVYFFSVSGAMHNIIRKMPMFMVDRNDPSKLVFFYQGSGMQLGAEGFAVGGLYTAVGLMLALVTHLLVRVRNVTAQRVIMVFVLIVSFWAVKKVVFLDNWKTGYGIHAFWPSSWN